MSSDDFPQVFDPSRCVLFLGAGFSADATNKNTDKKLSNPPVGDGLNRAMKAFAGISDEETSDLTDTAGYVLSKKLNLFDLLERLYTVKEPTELQRRVLYLPWWRIYTTNYDNLISVVLAEAGEDISKRVFDLTDNPPRQLRQGAVIHLHGSIAKCDSERVGESLVLSRRSYVEQRAKRSPWWDWFDRDVKTCQHMFFLGYDINDFEPASYLIKYPGMQHRRHFILRAPRSPIAEAKVADFGTRHAFELKGFVERLDRAKEAAAPSHANELDSIRYVSLVKDNKLPPKPTSAEIQELFSFGRLRFDAICGTMPESEYVLVRSRTLAACKVALQSNTTLVIHSKIGNGKSVLSDELKVSLSQEGRQCFVLREGIIPAAQDINFIKALDSPVVFFPSYDSAITNIHLFEGMPESAKYVVEVPSSTIQVRMQEALSKLRGNVHRIGVDKLDRDDVTVLRTLLRKAGLSGLAGSPRLREGIEFREFLLISYEYPEVARRIKAAIDPLMRTISAKKVICASAVFKATGLPVDVGFVEDATGEDPYAVLSGLGETVYELMEYSIDKLEPHSSVLSEHILRRYIEAKDFLGAVYSLAAEAARRIDESRDFSSGRFRLARSILSAVLRYGFLESVIGRGVERRNEIKQLYEACRRNSLIEKEPLFWLQYSIYWQVEPRWDLAESHMTEAYERGELRPEFKTFQLDTNFLGLLCDIERAESTGKGVDRLERILEQIDICREMIDDGNHRDHVTKAFLKLEPMIEKRVRDFSTSQAVSLAYSINLTERKLMGLSPEDKAIWGTEECRVSLERVVRKLGQHHAI